MTDDRRLIEDYLPIQAISAEAAREKSVRLGHISTLHLWWARRPLVAARAAVYGALVPAARFVPAEGEEAAKSAGREQAKEFVEGLCKYPGSPTAIANAQQHILEAHAERLSIETGRKVTVKDIELGHAPRPKVLDMFAGGGAIPLEALRLGCETHALDLNPVAHIIELCTLVYPQKYGRPDPSAKGSSPDGTWAGLAAEVEHWGRWVLDRAKAEIGDLYPAIPDPSAPGEEIGAEPQTVMSFARPVQGKLSTRGGRLTPVAYLWTRTVRCKNPDCAAVVPLVKQTWLCKKAGRNVALKIVADSRPRVSKRVRFQVVEAPTQDGLGFDPSSFSRGGNASCPFCGTVADTAYVKAEGVAGRIGHQLMAVACSQPGRQGKAYLAADDLGGLIPDDQAIRSRMRELCRLTGLSVPDEPMPRQGTLGFRVQPYGIRTWGELFSPRQLLCLLSFASAIRQAEREMTYSPEHRQSVVVVLAAMLDRLADFSSMGCHWNPVEGERTANTFSRGALPMLWDYSETAPFNEENAGWPIALERIIPAIRSVDFSNAANVSRGSATSLPYSDDSLDAVVTDPPYYDNVPYADLSDFFYVWLKRTIGHLFPEHFTGEGTPKRNEAVADATRHGGDRKRANAAYEDMMSKAFSEAHRVLKPGGALVIVYAHKTTLGWATLVEALRRSHFTVTEAWPLDTEKPGRLRAQESAALASSIFLVARKRSGGQTGSYEEEVRRELERIVRERVGTLWDLGIVGADLIIAAVGAGLRAFTRFERVEFANGEEVPAERFLAEVEGVVLETMLERIFGLPSAGVAAVDGPSRFYVLWRYAYKAAEIEAGEAIVFTYGQPVELDGPTGLASGRHSLVEKSRGKYRLRDFTERGQNDKLGLTDGENAAPLIDVLHRVLWLMEHEPRNLGRFLDEARPDRERLRLVAQALAGAGLKGKAGDEAKMFVTTTPTEQAALGKLTANWRSLMDAPDQMRFFA